VDRFASPACHQNLPFESRWACAEACREDTFTGRWCGMAWLTPPISLMHSVLAKALADEAPGLLVCPDWPTATWYPLLQRLQVDSFAIQVAAEVLPHANNPALPEVLRNRRWKFRVWLLDGSPV
jgi:hypothetical protein